jgi:hypothetical protein
MSVFDVSPFSVADISVMLALMASRNARETMSLVQNSQVSNILLLTDIFFMNDIHSGPNSLGLPSHFAVLS